MNSASSEEPGAISANKAGEIDSESAFEQFLADVDALTISTEPTTAANCEKDGVSVRRRDRSGKGANARAKQVVVARADEGQQSWQQFCEKNEKSDTKCSTNIAIANPESKVPSRKPVSFAIKKKSKKSKRGTRGAIEKSTKVDPHPPPSTFKRPCWVAVVDTCCFLDRVNVMESVLDVVHFAVHNQHHDWAERIEVVVPYKVWGELDYQSKLGRSAQDDGTASYRARRAIRMLESELQLQSDRAKLYLRNQGDCVKEHIRTQTLESMNDAAEQYLAPLASEANNDDHILACALAEQQSIQCSRASDLSSSHVGVGGLVLLTVDRNLSCKALANHLTVKNPLEFATCHRRRMNSLKARSQHV
uniref:PIN domain-containing protein n=1 Tax=Odontella aurita TaxID=265563 RepID=A0A7S4NHW5_9STRA|mmetsp:Transcript_7137/g.21263  ORF Transcript_7137/g.21263 Transcript_7137/m.21263 type:complete len:362 (+) Transcript_7137:151-1236(+)